MQFLTVEEWEAKSQAHYAEVNSYTQATRERRFRQEKHPVLDFLHSYYSYSLGSLEKWHPGLNYTLEIPEDVQALPDYYTTKHYHFDTRLSLDVSKLTEPHRDHLKYIRNLLAMTQARSPHFRCYGLHEWAMVYQGDAEEIRHAEQVPLRLPQIEIDAVVKSRDIVCTHFDAYRFFTPQAAPLNQVKPTLATRSENEQPGCIHANMDIYKWTYKCMPWVGSDLLKQTFLFALKAREIDMRASPYDLSGYGYAAIPVETAEGRAQYVQLQKDLSEEGRLLRQALMDAIDAVLISHDTTINQRLHR